MAATTVKKKAKPKKKHPLKKFISVFMIVIVCFLTYSSAKEVLITLKLHQEISQTQADLDDLAAKQQELEDQKTKFEDPEYVRVYARGKYLLTKEGEMLFKYQPNAEENANN